MKNIVFQTLTAFAFVLLASCEKDVSEKSTPESPVTYKSTIENYLIFTDTKSFYEAIDMVGVVANDDLINFSLKSGVKSYAAYYEEFLIRANDENLSESEYKNLLKEYADIITITDSVVSPRIQHPLIWHIINRHGLVKVENCLALYTENEKIISLKGDLNALMNAAETGYSSEEIRRARYIVDANSTKSPACGSNQSASRTVDRRRGVLICSVIFDFTRNYSFSCPQENTAWKYNFKTFAVSHGVPFRRIFGNWVNYRTNNRLDLKYKATTFGAVGPNGHPASVIVQYYHVDGFDAFSKTHAQLFAEGIGCWSENGNYQGFFNYMNPNRYTHRGLGHIHWATINCGN